MISGIDCEGLSDLSSRIKSQSYDLKDIVDDIKSEFEQIELCYEGIDLNFLYENYREEIQQLSKVNNKLDGYYLTFDEVINGYKAQEANIASGVHLYLNNKEER